MASGSFYIMEFFYRWKSQTLCVKGFRIFTFQMQFGFNTVLR